MPTTNKNLLAWIQLALSENVGPATFRQLVKFFGSPEEALKHIDEIATRGGAKRKVKLADEKMAQAQLKRIEQIGGQILTYKDDSYPKLLKQISDAPPLLFALGHVGLLNKRCVGIVGTRNASINGRNMARFLGCELVKKDFCVVSGMAKGIDRASHEGALSDTETSAGTIAVLGTPVDEIYPKENADIYAQIKERGCIISEFAFATQMLPTNFPRRNRIISGLSEGLIVIEAQVHSGSLITAREALSQGREVMAVPGFPLEPRSRGPNALIKDGAKLVETVDDVLDTLNQNRQFHLSEILPDEDTLPVFHALTDDVANARDEVLNALSAEPIEIGALVRATGIDLSVINIILVELELAGRLERHPGNSVSLIYGG